MSCQPTFSGDATKDEGESAAARSSQVMLPKITRGPGMCGNLFASRLSPLISRGLIVELAPPTSDVANLCFASNTNSSPLEFISLVYMHTCACALNIVHCWHSGNSPPPPHFPILLTCIKGKNLFFSVSFPHFIILCILVFFFLINDGL